MNPQIRVGLIGGGWRAAFYLRIARMLPHLFHICGVVLRDPAKYEDFLTKWKIPVYCSVKELARDSDFLVLAVSKSSAASCIIELAQTDIPVLAETPTATNLAEYRMMLDIAATGAPIQVAEQYPLQPHHQARTAFIHSGKLGDVLHVQVSAAHGYHGISLIRKWLSIDTRLDCEIIGRRFSLPIADVPYRDQTSTNDSGMEQQEIAIFSFTGGKSAVLDFTRSQYYSAIRCNRILIRGTYGEIRDNTVTRKVGTAQFETVSLQRVQSGQEGSLLGLSLLELQAGAESLYRNPFYPHPLSDEEIAIAEVLLKMHLFISQGTSFYSLSEALTDVRLAIGMEEAISENKTVTLRLE